ncbi:MAG: helicase-related protein, partial [Chloroflexota bacterium]
MRLINNSGADRVLDELRQCITARSTLDIATPAFSLFAYAELFDLLTTLAHSRVVLPAQTVASPALLGAEGDRAYRNRLVTRWLARACAIWLEAKVDVRAVPGVIAQSTLSVGSAGAAPTRVITGTCSFTTDGLGLTAGNGLSLVQVAESADECATLGAWFTSLWNSLPASAEAKRALLAQLRELAADHPPALVYFLTLYHLFIDLTGDLDEERIVKSATGIRDTVVWRKLYKFQRDGVIGAIDKLERFGGCIIADSVGLGKTFEALAVIKYHELRNDRVLVLVPKRLRDNWTLYKSNDRRNVLASDRFNYDILNHTDLSREGGQSGDMDLAFVKWGNYDLVVIDESHNFRNKKTPRQGEETRYDHLMRRIIQEGVKTRVLMLSATPVNNRLADLKNQLAFVTEGNDKALAAQGIASVESTIRGAQQQFNRWLGLVEAERRPARLMDMLGFDYFKLLDLLTIARSRKHIQKYYGIAETGRFPGRLRPINIKPDVDSAGQFSPIRDMNNEIRRLHLAAYAPLSYVLPSKQAAYNARYSQKVRGGTGTFRQLDREESLVHLLRVNVLKRMESSVASFALTLQRQLAAIDAMLAKIAANAEDMEERFIDEVDIDDPAFESLLVGHKVKVLLADVDTVRWRQDLTEDRDRVAALLVEARQVGTPRDAKLAALRAVIEKKCRQPLNAGNRKVIVFTAFADTAQYLYTHLATWARDELGLHTALVTGAGSNQTTLPGLRRDLGSILTAFAPRAKERPAEFAGEGELDLLIATDCISEGQNLQDCDMLINYDIHWNPVRIIQRFGRIDRIGSPNDSIQLVNFWPN